MTGVRKTIWDKANSIWDPDFLGTHPWADVPTGITVHYTADGSLNATKASMLQRKVGYHFVIDKDGSICQTASLGKAVNHAGVADWRGQSPNRSHIAIAFVSWGLLGSDGKSWAGTSVISQRKINGQLWEPATDAQESALMGLIRDMQTEFGILGMNICGHAECCIPVGRKIDPGGSLSMPMSELRKDLSS